MPNLCYNLVSFIGNSTSEMKAIAAFNDLAEGRLALPPLNGIERNVFLDLKMSGNRHFCYDTHDGPNTELITAYARHFGADHHHYYIEPRMAICGEVFSHQGIAEEFQVTPSDLLLIDYDAACDQFEFRHGKADDPYDLWSILLEEKQKAMLNPDVKRRLSGELPHILLGPDDYIVDLPNRAFVKADERSHRIDMNRMILQEDEDSYLMFYYLPAQQAVPPPRDLRECPDNVWILEVPREWELDPVGFARQRGRPDSDNLLSHPHQAYRCATAYSAAEFMELQRRNQRDR